MSTSGSRAASVPLIGGHPVLDLINTVSWRGAANRQEDQLTDLESCLTWAIRIDVINAAEAGQLRTSLSAQAVRTCVAELRNLREVAAQVVTGPTPAAAANVHQMIIDAFRHAELREGNLADAQPYQWHLPGLDEETITRRLVLALHLLMIQPQARIGTCDDDCQWMFLDTSRSRNRRWCDSRDCGNRHRARQHQQRRRDG